MGKKAIGLGVVALAAIFAIPSVVLPALREREAKSCVERVTREHAEAALRPVPASCSNPPSSRLGFGGGPECNTPDPLPAWEASTACLKEREAKP